RCRSVRSSRISIRWNALKRDRMLARDAATATRNNKVASCCGSSMARLSIIIMKARSLPMLTKVAEANFPSRFGHFRIYGFEGMYNQEMEECVVLRMGDVASGSEPPLVRIHSQCLTGDVFHSLRCDCRSQLELALNLIA